MTAAELQAPALEVVDLSVRFGAVAALSEVSFEVAPGQLFAVIGPNGAGKTSLFNVLSRVYDPFRGSLRFFGTDMTKMRAHQLAGAGIARTFQNLALFRSLTVLDNVLVGREHLMRTGPLRAGLFLRSARREESENRRAAYEALDFVGLREMAGVPVGLLPYGVQKRVEIARALAMEPKLLLLDEPVAGMSRSERSEIEDLVRSMHRDRGLSIVLVEHDMGFVMTLAERVLVLDFGRTVALGTPTEVQSDPYVIAAYLGEAHQERDQHGVVQEETA